MYIGSVYYLLLHCYGDVIYVGTTCSRDVWTSHSYTVILHGVLGHKLNWRSTATKLAKECGRQVCCKFHCGGALLKIIRASLRERL